MQKLQNWAARGAINSCFDAPSEPHIQEFGWLTIEQLIELETVKVVYKALQNEAPLSMKELFLKLSDTERSEQYNFSTVLYTFRLRTSMGQKSFEHRGVRFWNDQLDKAKGARTYLAFKRFLCKNKR